MTLQEASLNLTEEEYREYPCLSYSNLSKYDRDGYESLETLFDSISTTSLAFGSLVDYLLTQSDKDLTDKFAIVEALTSPPLILNIVTKLAETRSEKQMALISDESILYVADMIGYQTNWKPETRISKIRMLGSSDYNQIKSCENKIRITQKDLDDAKSCIEALKSDPTTSWYFWSNPMTGTEALYQLQFVSRDISTDIEFKGMLDLVLIDHANKRIYPCDLKTTKSIYTFENSFYTYRYYIQAAMYTQLLYDTIMNKCPELSNYTIEPYRFIVISRATFKPVVFQWKVPDKSEHLKAPNGEPLSDWRELLERLTWDISNKDTKLPKPWYENLKKDGFITIKRYL